MSNLFQYHLTIPITEKRTKVSMMLVTTTGSGEGDVRVGEVVARLTNGDSLCSFFPLPDRSTLKYTTIISYPVVFVVIWCSSLGMYKRLYIHRRYTGSALRNNTQSLRLERHVLKRFDCGYRRVKALVNMAKKNLPLPKNANSSSTGVVHSSKYCKIYSVTRSLCLRVPVRVFVCASSNRQTCAVVRKGALRFLQTVAFSTYSKI